MRNITIFAASLSFLAIGGLSQGQTTQTTELDDWTWEDVDQLVREADLQRALTPPDLPAHEFVKAIWTGFFLAGIPFGLSLAVIGCHIWSIARRRLSREIKSIPESLALGLAWSFIVWFAISAFEVKLPWLFLLVGALAIAFPRWVVINEESSDESSSCQ